MSEQIQRYYPRQLTPLTSPPRNDDVVKYADHLAAVEKLEAENKALREKVARVEAESLAMLDASGRR